MEKGKDTYRWSDPEVVLILSRDYLEDALEKEIQIDGEMSDDLFEELKIEIREKSEQFLKNCYQEAKKQLPRVPEDYRYR